MLAITFFQLVFSESGGRNIALHTKGTACKEGSCKFKSFSVSHHFFSLLFLKSLIRFEWYGLTHVLQRVFLNINKLFLSRMWAFDIYIRNKTGPLSRFVFRWDNNCSSFIVCGDYNTTEMSVTFH